MAALSGDSKAARLMQWQAGQTPGPWEVILFPTNRCNLKCSICWQRWAEKEFGKVDFASELSDERLLRLVDEAAELGVREWNIVGGGEPMVRGPLVMKLCENIRRHGMNGSIQSNGTRFKPEHFEQLIAMGWNRIVVSLDGPTAEINDAIRSERSFQDATDNLRTLAELKRKHGATKPEACLNTVVTNLNYNRLDDMVRLGKEIGCDAVGAISLVVQGSTCAEFALTPEQLAELPAHLDRAAKLASELKIAGSFRLLDDALRGWPGCAPVVTPDPNDLANAVCFEPWLSMAILAEGGKGGPCSPFWEKDVDTVKDKPLREVWLGPYLTDVRARILAHKNLPPYCSTCCSHIPSLTQGIREQLMAARTTPDGLPARLLHNLKTRGLRQTVRRGYEWVKLRAGTRR